MTVFDNDIIGWECIVLNALQIPDRNIIYLFGKSSNEKAVKEAISKVPTAYFGVSQNTITHMTYAYRCGNDPLHSLTEDVQPQFGYRCLTQSNKSEFLHLMDDHSRFYDGRRDHLLEELKKNCLYTYSTTTPDEKTNQNLQEIILWPWEEHGDNARETTPQFTIQKKYVEEFKRYEYLIDHMKTMSCMYKKLKICAKMIYRRNSIISRAKKDFLFSHPKKNKQEDHFLSATCLNAIVEINGALLGCIKLICSALLEDLKTGIRLKIVPSRFPFFKPCTILRCISTLMDYVPGYLLQNLQLMKKQEQQDDEELVLSVKEYMIPSSGFETATDSEEESFTNKCFGFLITENNAAAASPYTEKSCPLLLENTSDWKSLL